MAQIFDLGIDIGTSRVVFYGRGHGIVLNEPATISVDMDTGKVLAVGEEAQKMLGRAPGNINVMRPLLTGTIKGFDALAAMMRELMNRAVGKHYIGGPRIVMSVPYGVNDVERRSLMTTLFEAGARRTQVLDRPTAAALGAGLEIGEAYGEMIVDIGAGMTDIAVITCGSVNRYENFAHGGTEFDEAIIRYIKRRHNVLIGEVTAEELKVHIGAAIPRTRQLYMDVTGRSLITGLPKVLRVTSDEIAEAIDEPLQDLIDSIHKMLEHTNPELASDISDNGIVLSGGGALLTGIAEAVSLALKVDCRVAENPQECVARGCGLTLEKMNEYGKYLNSSRRK